MWGSFTQVRFQMEMIRAALTEKAYDYLFMLSAQDYPVWSNQRMMQYLEENKGKNFLQGMSMAELPHSETYEYTRYRFLNNKPWRYGTLKSKFRVALRKLCEPFLKKPLVFEADGKTYSLYKGSDYFAITGELAAYLLETYDQSPELRRYFTNSFAPSETFAHTVAFNSRFADSCILTKGPVKKLEQLTPLTYIEYGQKIKILTENDYDSMDNLKEKTAKGLFWGALNNGTIQVLNVLIGIMLGRKLSPEEWAPIGMIAIFSAIAGNLQSSGFSTAIVNMKAPTSNDYNAVFWFNTLVSAIVYLVLFACAPWIAWFFEQPCLTDLSRFIFLAFFISSFGISTNAYMMKNMMQREMTIVGVTALIISGITAIILAFQGYSYWSLAWQQVINALVLVVGRWVFVKWRPSFTPHSSVTSGISSLRG